MLPSLVYVGMDIAKATLDLHAQQTCSRAPLEWPKMPNCRQPPISGHRAPGSVRTSPKK